LLPYFAAGKSAGKRLHVTRADHCAQLRSEHGERADLISHTGQSHRKECMRHCNMYMVDGGGHASNNKEQGRYPESKHAVTDETHITDGRVGTGKKSHCKYRRMYCKYRPTLERTIECGTPWGAR
jgi:hypothetical protein